MSIKLRGFTVIELMMVVMIIGILASFGTVQLLRTQLVARDKERIDDVNTIALFLEGVYKTGQPGGVLIPSGDSTITTATPMGYPSTKLVSSASDVQSQAITGAIDPVALKSPLKKSISLTAATSSTSLTGSTVNPLAANDNYVYQPLKENGSLCEIANSSNPLIPNPQDVIAPRLDNECVKFKIYYMSEAKKVWLVKESLNSQMNGL